jgi:PAS domain S-box-containing protein
MDRSADERMDFQTADAAFVIDSTQRIVEWTPAAERVLGFKAEETTGRPCYDVICGMGPGNRRVCNPNCPVITGARHGRAVPSFDLVSHKADGRPVWLNISVVLIRSTPDGAPRTLNLFRDVTRQRQVEERARQTLELLGQASRGQIAANGHVSIAAGSDSAPEHPVSKLSPREKEVLQLLSLGLTTEQIAESLSVSRVTARNHINRLLLKLGVQSRLQAVIYASQQGLV